MINRIRLPLYTPKWYKAWNGYSICFRTTVSRYLSIIVKIYHLHYVPHKDIPRCSMSGILTYIWVIVGVNVCKYSIHGASGFKKKTPIPVFSVPPPRFSTSWVCSCNWKLLTYRKRWDRLFTCGFDHHTGGFSYQQCEGFHKWWYPKGMVYSGKSSKIHL